MKKDIITQILLGSIKIVLKKKFKFSQKMIDEFYREATEEFIKELKKTKTL